MGDVVAFVNLLFCQSWTVKRRIGETGKRSGNTFPICDCRLMIGEATVTRWKVDTFEGWKIDAMKVSRRWTTGTMSEGNEQGLIYVFAGRRSFPH